MRVLLSTGRPTPSAVRFLFLRYWGLGRSPTHFTYNSPGHYALWWLILHYATSIKRPIVFWYMGRTLWFSSIMRRTALTAIFLLNKGLRRSVFGPCSYVPSPFGCRLLGRFLLCSGARQVGRVFEIAHPYGMTCFSTAGRISTIFFFSVNRYSRAFANLSFLN